MGSKFIKNDGNRPEYENIRKNRAKMDPRPFGVGTPNRRKSDKIGVQKANPKLASQKLRFSPMCSNFQHQTSRKQPFFVICCLCSGRTSCKRGMKFQYGKGKLRDWHGRALRLHTLPSVLELHVLLWGAILNHKKDANEHHTQQTQHESPMKVTPLSPCHHHSIIN